MNVFIVAYSYIAAVIGAGFASGQEILSFFVVHGRFGAFGILLASLIFGCFAYFIVNFCIQKNKYDYNELITEILGKKTRILSDVLTFVFLIASFAVMTACFGEMAYMMFNFNKIASEAVFDAICVMLVCMGSDKALKLNGIMGIIISVGIISVVVYILRYREHQTLSPYVSSFISGGGYAGYNLIGSGIILAKMSKNINTKKDAATVGVISGVSLFMMMSLIYILLSIYYKYINLGEIPVLTLAIRENRVISCIYSIILGMAVVSTAISSNIGASEIIKKNKKGSIIIGFLGFFLSNIGFSNIINTIYRACGYAGILLLLYVVIMLKKSQKN